MSANQEPVCLAEACVAAIGLGDDAEPLVKATIVSDVRAGRDLVRGVALAAPHTAEINLPGLEERENLQAATPRQRQNAACRAATEPHEDQCPPA